jgi:hypothetical protein
VTVKPDLSGIPSTAWQQGIKTAKAGHIPSIGADDHILAAHPGPPWIEPRWPPRREPRTVTLHGGPYDACRLEVYSLGQHLTVGGEHGPALYEYKEHDASTAAYTAVDDSAVPALIPEPPPTLEAAEHMEALF